MEELNPNQFVFLISERPLQSAANSMETLSFTSSIWCTHRGKCHLCFLLCGPRALVFPCVSVPVETNPSSNYK